MQGLPSALRSITRAAGSCMSSTAAIWGAPSSTPQLRSRQGGCSQPNLHAPGQGCRQSFACSASIMPMSFPCIPRLPSHHSHTAAVKLETVVWKLCANMQIISLCRWHEMAHAEQIKAWQLQKWGKRKGVQKGMLSSLILPLPSTRASWGGGAGASRLAWESVTSPPSFPWLPPSCLVNAAEHRCFGWHLFTYRASSVPRLQYMRILPSLV